MSPPGFPDFFVLLRNVTPAPFIGNAARKALAV
jgi:hypothetical protein